ncbi:hypothetical protein [Psychromonas arctica]|uniref:hypothetical protein n=1 Tax=Psychromonas arctica TaxID=168275 RepID=UPI00041F2064|nr:hypothetical protein [Psychromonas arctica]
METTFYLFGGLASHRRGAVISDYLPVKLLDSDGALPAYGALMMFGLEWQTYSTEQQANLMVWLKSSGRSLLLIPPFNTGELSDVLDWQVENINDDKTTSVNGLAQNLADEVRFQFEAVSHQFSSEYAHNWNDDSLNTLYYKPHSSGGVFVATSLPLWSLTCLDIPEIVKSWLAGLSVIAGQVKEPTLDIDKAMLVLNENHLVLLCCAYGHSFKDANSLVQRVGRLGVFRLLSEELDLALVELIDDSLFLNGELTEKGLAALVASPYKLYADELKRMPG